MKTKTTNSKQAGAIPDRLYFKIGDVADLVDVKPYVLRYWESEFPVLAPEKKSTGQRVYRRSDVETLLMIKHLLYTERYSIEGARRRIREMRKEGSLKEFREKAVQASGAQLGSPQPTAEVAPSEDAAESTVQTSAARMLRVRELARSLVELSRKPVSEIFRA